MTTYDEPEFDEPNPPEESSNRTFLLVAGILGLLVLLGLLCIGGYFLLPEQLPTSKINRRPLHR